MVVDMALFYAQDVNNDGNIVAFWNRSVRDLFVSKYPGFVRSVTSSDVETIIRNTAKYCGRAYVDNALGRYEAFCFAIGRSYSRPCRVVDTAFRVMFRR